MERHRKEVQESRAKLRKLEADTRQMEDLKNKITDFENKTSKLTKEAGKFKEQEIELSDTKSKNRDLQRQVRSKLNPEVPSHCSLPHGYYLKKPKHISAVCPYKSILSYRNPYHVDL